MSGHAWDPGSTAGTASMPSRRQMLAGAATGMATGLVTGFPRSASAQAKEFVLVNWGGISATNLARVYGEPFAKESGLAFKVDGSGPTLGRIKAMVEAKKVIWDVADTDLFTGISLGKLGLLETIDYSIVDKTKIADGFGNEYGAGSYITSWVMGYNKKMFPGEPPRTPADLFDTKKFPGKRGVFAGVQSTVEWALRADGVPDDKLYPLDIERAAKKLKTLGSDLVTYTTSPDAMRRFRAGEFAICLLTHWWASVAEEETKGDVSWSFDHALMAPQAYVIPKGNPAGAKAANEFIRSAQSADRQIEMFLQQYSGPVNPDAIARITADKRRYNPTDPSNIGKQLLRNDQWYADNYIEANAKFRELLAT